jgi:hypothetical protein
MSYEHFRHVQKRRLQRVQRGRKGKGKCPKYFFCRPGLTILTPWRREVKKTTGSAKKPKLPESPTTGALAGLRIGARGSNHAIQSIGNSWTPK